MNNSRFSILLEDVVLEHGPIISISVPRAIWLSEEKQTSPGEFNIAVATGKFAFKRGVRSFRVFFAEDNRGTVSDSGSLC